MLGGGAVVILESSRDLVSLGSDALPLLWTSLDYSREDTGWGGGGVDPRVPTPAVANISCMCSAFSSPAEGTLVCPFSKLYL